MNAFFHMIIYYFIVLNRDDVMKRELEYYYGIREVEIHYKDGKYYIIKDSNKYIFKPCYRDYREIVEINTLIDSNLSIPFHSIILNRSNELITVIDNVPYILLKLKIEDERFIDFNDLIKYSKKKIYFEQLNLKSIIRVNWSLLWSKKIDYFEYQMKHLKEKYKILSSSIDFYIGLGENGISYVNEILSKNINNNISVCVSHRRLLYKTTITEFFDPTELIIDYKARDVCEYLKSLFLFGECDFEYLDNFFRSLSFDRVDFEMLFGRLLFPSFYFDIYEDIINGKRDEKDILKVISKSCDYITFLKKIYDIIYKIYPIKKIDWL